MKTNKFFLIILIIILGFFLLRIPKNRTVQNQIQNTPTPAQIIQQVTTIIDYGEGKKTTHLREYSPSQSAYALLEKIADEQQVPLKVKKYSFGTLVEGIGTYQNSADKSWIYFVNSQSASVSADQYILNASDLIEWKFVKPQ